MPSTVNISGTLYDAVGSAITTGTLYVTLQQDMILDGQKITPTRLSLPVTGAISFNIYPTAGAYPTGITYYVQYDPDPADLSKPMHAKIGYWENYWVVPTTPSTQSIGSFPVAIRSTALAAYLPTTSWARGFAADLRVVSGNTTLTASDNGCMVYIDSGTARTMTLPQPAAGLHFTLACGQAAAHVLSPTGSSKFNGLGLTKTNGQTLVSAVSAGNFVRIVAVDTSNWYILESRGTWS
jgi:hypothetical protein